MQFQISYAKIHKRKNTGMYIPLYLKHRTKGVRIMPNIKSAKKRVKVNATKAANNKAANSALKTAIKKANTAIETNAADKDALVKIAVKKIDQAASKNLMPKNRAARKKSKLVKKANA